MHVDPDTLALLALGERVADDASQAHLASCPECAADLRKLSEAVAIGRSTLDAGELIDPAPRVWDRISEELGIQHDLPAERGDDSRRRRRGTVTDLSTRRRSRWIGVAAVAAAAAVVTTVGVVAWQTGQADAPTVEATATLEAFPGWAGAGGDAVLERRADGSRVVRIDVSTDTVGDDYVEAWLIASDGEGLVSLGTIAGTSGTFAVPDGLDLAVYDLVDVSAEPFDGDPAHSGDSIARGELTSRS